MKKREFVLSVLFLLSTSGCASEASEALLEKMCDKKLEITGVLRGTSVEEESARISDEYAHKEKSLKEEMDRDLKGMDDVLGGMLKEIEADENASTKAERTEAAKANIEKKKQAIVDQFEPLIKKLAPQKKHALREAEEYVQKRKADAEKQKTSCISRAKASAVTEDMAKCRIQAKSSEAYDACK